jgi:hypothetical protein
VYPEVDLASFVLDEPNPLLAATVLSLLLY